MKLHAAVRRLETLLADYSTVVSQLRVADEFLRRADEPAFSTLFLK